MGYDRSPQTAMPVHGQHPADRHFLDQSGRGYASNDQAGACVIRSEIGEAHQGHFTIFQGRSVSLTSTHLAGGDWRWRLTDADDYRSEAHCREAVAILQARAARATVA